MFTAGAYLRPKTLFTARPLPAARANAAPATGCTMLAFLSVWAYLRAPTGFTPSPVRAVFTSQIFTCLLACGATLLAISVAVNAIFIFSPAPTATAFAL